MGSGGGGGGWCCIGDCCIKNCCVIDLCCIFDFGTSSGGSSSSCCVGYHSGPSESEVHAKKIADDLAKMKEKYRKASEKEEQQIMDNISISLEDLLEEIQKINNVKFGGRTLNIDLVGIRRKNEELKNSVRGSIGNVMDERLVLTDRELSVILQERDDKKREKNFDDFCDRVRRQAITTLIEKIKTTVKAQSDMINNSIRNRLSEVDNNMRETQLAYNEILRNKEQGDAKREETAIKHIYKYELVNLLLEQLK